MRVGRDYPYILQCQTTKDNLNEHDFKYMVTPLQYWRKSCSVYYSCTLTLKKVRTVHLQSNLCRADNIVVLPVALVRIVQAGKFVLPVHSLGRICHNIVG